MPAHAETLMTAEELEAVEIPGKWTELVRGRLVVREPPSTWHGFVSGRLGHRVGGFVFNNKLGEVAGQDTGFKIASNPDTVRAPDLAFVSKERAGMVNKRGYAAIAPDLAIEVLSPGDRAGETLSRVGDWLVAGVRLVWVVDPARKLAHVHRLDGSLTLVGPEGALDGEDVLPGFSCRLADILG